MPTRKRVKIGDIIEIDIDGAFAYAQYTHNNQKYGYLIRVFPGIFSSRLEKFEDLVETDHNFAVFFPLQSAVNQDIVRVVSNEIIPPRFIKFPVFKSGLRDPVTKEINVWWLWDGENEWRVDELSEDQYDFPRRCIINDTMLIEWIQRGYRPSDDVGPT